MARPCSTGRKRASPIGESIRPVVPIWPRLACGLCSSRGWWLVSLVMGSVVPQSWAVAWMWVATQSQMAARALRHLVVLLFCVRRSFYIRWVEVCGVLYDMTRALMREEDGFSIRSSYCVSVLLVWSCSHVAAVHSRLGWAALPCADVGVPPPTPHHVWICLYSTSRSHSTKPTAHISLTPKN
jgi:hypothetical protein